MLLRANADTPEQAAAAREAGIPGIGLCRTETLLVHSELSKWLHSVLAIAKEPERREAFSTLLPMCQAAFEEIFSVMSPHPVFVRLLDPPIQDLLPSLEQIDSRASGAFSDEDWDQWIALSLIRERLADVSAWNPILGNRGCRLCVTYPEIMTLQITAILQAALAIESHGVNTSPAILIPLVATEEEASVLVSQIRSIANHVFLRIARKVDYKVGVLIELPRAALCAGAIARHVDFVCFGTNDLTQMSFGFSREESRTYLQKYLEQGIFKDDPFLKFDKAGVGQLLNWATRDIRSQQPEMEIGICGDHCGDDDALRFFQSLDIDFASCPLSSIEKLRQTLERDEVKASSGA